MESLLRLVNKSPSLNYLLLAFSGSITSIAFSPFDVKPIIILSLAILIYSIQTSINFFEAFKRSFVWGLCYWISGTGWLIVSIYYYGNTYLSVSILLIVLMGIMLSITFITPISFIKILATNQNVIKKSLIFAALLTLMELSRFFLLGGSSPWLLPGLVFTNTFAQISFPIIGIYGASFIIYFLSSILALSIFYKNRNILILSIFCLIIFIPKFHSAQVNSSKALDIGIVQPSLDPFKKYEYGGAYNIEETLLNITNQITKVDLIIWPESPLPYVSSNSKMQNLIDRIDNESMIISGAWTYEDNNLLNSMILIGENQSYSKRHLVPFGEYVPFEDQLRGLINFFDLPMSSISKGKSNQALFKVNDFHVLGLICFDVAFPLSFLKEFRNADFIINISNDTWFGKSYGPHQHLQIVKARAIESNKWIARGTSDGISTIVDNKGTIVEKLSKGKTGFIVGTIYSTNKSTIFYSFGYLIVPLASLFILLAAIIKRVRK
ncbi:MAG: apolipoprotein N-acyltransferase [Gammaproteobacteria bacterium]|nr:apolipoprotein N-acyltransferase [Gammaproteobacteria bacterium]